jgi:hypothetical protein
METATLRAILEAGDIAADEATIARLASHLSALGQQYRLIRFARADRPRREQILDRLVEIRSAVARVSAIIDNDLGGSCEIELLLNAFRWRADDAPHLHRLHDAADQAVMLLATSDPASSILAPNEQPETWLFVELREVHKRLSGRKKIGRDRPLDRFIRRAAKAIGGDIMVPAPEALTARLRAALDRKGAL